jgi:hypothetical protein
MNEIKDKHLDGFKVEVLSDSGKFRLPISRMPEVVKDMVSKYREMPLIELDSRFKGKFEPIKYIRTEIRTSDIDEQNMIVTLSC